MTEYFFVLGRTKALSIAEILAVFSRLKIDISLKTISAEIAIIESHELNIENLVDYLGGTIKAGRIISRVNLKDNENDLEKLFSAKTLSQYIPKRGKIHFGISCYDAAQNKLLILGLENKLKYLNELVKEKLKEFGFKPGFVRLKGRVLSSVSVVKNKLLTQGAEFVLIITDSELYLGVTQAVQNFTEFSFRDMERPFKDKRSGIMPVKLARMMINLAQVKSDEILLDPFCGSGTILQEAILLNVKKIIGTDNNRQAVANTQKNINWFFDNFKKIPRREFSIKITTVDVRNLSRFFSPYSIDAIVTEPYLGPPFHTKPTNKTITAVIKDLTTLYKIALSEMSKILKPNGSIVIIFPVFENNHRLHSLEILEEIQKFGLKVVLTIYYDTSTLFLKREIIKLVKYN